MAKLTDQEVIQYFQNRKQELTQELRKVETVLSTLIGGSAPKKRKYTRRQATTAKPGRKPKSAAASPTAAVKPATPAKAKKAPRKAATTQTAAASKGNDTKGSWDSKIHDALSQIGSGNKEDIVQFIAGKESGASPEKIQKALTLRLAILTKAGKLKVESAGEQQQYSLS